MTDKSIGERDQVSEPTAEHENDGMNWPGRLRQGFWLSIGLALVFLAATASTAVGMMLQRISKTDVTKAAAGGAWSGVIALQIAEFVVAVLVLHAAFGALAWLLAAANAQIWQRARQRFLLFVTGWFCLLVAAVISYDALWYPRTLMGAYYNFLMIKHVGPLQLGQLIYLGAVAVSITVLLVAGWRVYGRGTPTVRRRMTVAATTIAAVTLFVLVDGRFRPVAVAAADAGKPNVIILGIDSLRLNELQRFGGTRGVTPSLDRFLSGADVFRDTSTPAARTFSSWVAILSGRTPIQTGARCNLTNRKVVSANPTFADVLRQQGYHTVYSTDDVRFANIDTSYGFDQVITPPIGAADFMIGDYNELPLAAVIINTGLGKYLFPFSYGNRGVAMMFEPETFVGRVDRELQVDGPTLFISHLTAAHWPYYTSETPFGVQNDPGAGDLTLYRAGLRTADTMFGELLKILERKGALRNAIVIVLSDHGEAFGLDSDTFYRDGAIVKGLGAPMTMTALGHGQSVLSPVQYKTLLAFRAFGRISGYESSGSDYGVPVTVEDIGPTFLDLLGVPSDELRASGKSLAAVLRTGQGDAAGLTPDRIRFTETDLGVLPATNGTIDATATARKYSRFFGIDPADGRLAIRDDFLPLALAYKERAAFSPTHLLAAIPAGPHADQYVYFDTVTGDGQLLLERPGPDLPEGQRLWDALQAHYVGELRPATRVTLDDWPRIERDWVNFFVDRRKKSAHDSETPRPPTQ
jgi:arylsulfatase A-like enzyme